MDARMQNHFFLLVDSVSFFNGFFNAIAAR